MDKKIQRIILKVASPELDSTRNEFSEDFIDGAKKLLGINFKSDISGDSLVDVHIKGHRIIDDIPVDAFLCNEDYVAPNNRFLTLIPDTGDIETKSIEITIGDDGTAGSYPYTATVLLLLEVK